jgi:spore coat protein SA
VHVLAIAPEDLPVPPIKGGSVESCIHNVFSRMAETERVTIISRAHHRLPARSVSRGGRLTIVRLRHAKRREYVRAAMRYAKGREFSVIQIENRPTFVPFVRKSFPNTPIVLSLHSLTFMSLLSRRTAHSVLGRVDGVTTVVSFVTETMKTRYPAHAHKFRTAILGVDGDAFRPRAESYKRRVRRKWGVEHGKNLLFVGRIIRMKGLDTLVRAAALLRRRGADVRVIAVGARWPGVRRETADMRQVRRVADARGVPICFTGYVPPSELPEMFHLGDVFVCPSRFREGFATVNSEAMASGIPVVASRRGGIPEVVEHEKSGLLVERYRSGAAFADAIERVLSSPRVARRLGEGGRRRAVRHFSWYRTVDLLRKHYRSLR